MASYFPLPPNIKIDSSNEKILGSLTFLNFPNNLQKKNIPKVYTKEIYLGVYIIENSLWKLVSKEKCLFKDFLEINRKSLSLSDEEMAVAIIRKSNDFPENCESLPKPDSLRVDKAGVEERASYNFSYNSFQASYEGEYPVEMSKISKANFLSFDGLKGIGGAVNKVKNYLLLMNLNISSSINDIKKVKIYDPKDNSQLLELDARQNLVSIHDISLLANVEFSDKIFFISSNESLFIPLMLSLDLKTNQLSLEHTHPSSEMFFGFDKWHAVRLIKKKWVL